MGVTGSISGLLVINVIAYYIFMVSLRNVWLPLTPLTVVVYIDKSLSVTVHNRL